MIHEIKLQEELSHDELLYYLGNDDYIFEPTELIENYLDEYENSIRTDERRKFAETLSKVNWEAIKDNVDIPQFILNLAEYERSRNEKTNQNNR